uniref:Putative prefoldin subunit 3 n=1 Tax=Rhizophora mucronata TaxID=61149 RepID=A0A2P2KNL2_RHIMU
MFTSAGSNRLLLPRKTHETNFQFRTNSEDEIYAISLRLWPIPSFLNLGMPMHFWCKKRKALQFLVHYSTDIAVESVMGQFWYASPLRCNIL